MQMKFSLPLLLVVLLVGSAAAAAAEPSDAEMQEAIDFVKNMLSNSDAGSGSTWNLRMMKVITALKAHPKYSKWLAADEAAAAAAAAHSNYNLPTFNCKLEKSPSTPTSVHRLRPADIKMIGAMGDSLTSANGALATSILGLLTQYRGYAWSIGGQVALKDHVTLANVIREGNSDLYGHSTGSGSVSSTASRLNVAEAGKEANHMPGQADSLIKKMKSDSKVDYNNDWKLITVFVGGNDLCRYCNDKEKYSSANFIKYVREALDKLHAEVPRAFVNVAEVLDVSLVKELQDGSSTCRLLQGSFLCKCAANAANEAELKRFQSEYQKELRDLVNSGRYDTRSDFTVVNQPFFRNTEPPRINGKYDLSFFAPDCFHFSRRGHAEGGKALWNNMLQPIGQKSTQWDLNGGFLCPSSSRPYFATSKN